MAATATDEAVVAARARAEAEAARVKAQWRKRRADAKMVTRESTKLAMKRIVPDVD